MIKSKIAYIAFYFLAYQIAATQKQIAATQKQIAATQKQIAETTLLRIIDKCVLDPKYYESVFKDFEATNPRTITFYKFMEQPDKVLDGTEVLPIFDDKYERVENGEIKYKEVLDIEALKAQCIEVGKKVYREYYYRKAIHSLSNQIIALENNITKLTKCHDILFFINSIIFFLFCFEIISAFVFYTITIILILCRLLTFFVRMYKKETLQKHSQELHLELYQSLCQDFIIKPCKINILGAGDLMPR